MYFTVFLNKDDDDDDDDDDGAALVGVLQDNLVLSAGFIMWIGHFER